MLNFSFHFCYTESMIGVFDSGVGGLTVVSEIKKLLPEQKIIYFGDTAHLPYGTKGERFVRESSEKITKWLLGKGADVIVVACNTSSAWASDYLKEKFPKTPIFEMITPAIKDMDPFKKIGVIGTPGTVESQVYNKKLFVGGLDPEVFSVSCPLFVPLAEEGWLEGRVTEEIAERYLKPLKDKEIEALVLACTHYPLLKNVIKRISGKRIKIVNPAESLAKELASFLKKNPVSKDKGKSKYYFTDNPYNCEKISRLCLGNKIKPILIKPL